MEASQYKDYVLMMLFLKYLSDKDRAGADLLIDIPEGCHFDDIVALKWVEWSLSNLSNPLTP